MRVLRQDDLATRFGGLQQRIADPVTRFGNSKPTVSVSVIHPLPRAQQVARLDVVDLRGNLRDEGRPGG